MGKLEPLVGVAPARTIDRPTGGVTVEAPAPLEHIPVFIREGAAVAAAFTAD